MAQVLLLINVSWKTSRMYVHLFNWPVSPSFTRMGGPGENNGIWGSLKFEGRLKIENIHLSITVLERYGMEALKIDPNMERRFEKRHACSEEIFFATKKRLYEGQLKDYGRNGLFIKTKEVLAVGETITVVDPHPAGGNIKRKGQILWRNMEGFAVELYRHRNEREHSVIRFEKRSINSKL